MTMLGMQADMHYFPSYFSTRDVNLNGSCSVWPSSNADRVLMNGHYYNGNMAAPFPDQYLAYKDKFKQIMLQHEAIFKSQVHELHRLYNKQRELMVEMKRIQFRGQHLQLENSTSNQIFSEASSEYKQKASIVSAIPWLNPAREQSFVPFIENKKSHTAYVQGNMMLAGSSIVQTKGNRNECEFLESNCKKVGKKILDLELPAYEYIDSDTEESLAEEMNPSEIPSYPMKSFVENVQKNDAEPCHGIDDASVSMRTKCFADLNEPIKLEEETDSQYNDFLHPVSGHEETQRQNLPGKGNSQLQFQAQVIQKTETREDPQSSSKVIQQKTSEDQQECLSDNDEDDDDIEQGPEISPSHLLDLNDGNLKSKRKYHDESSSVSSLRKHTRNLERIPIIVQALPCSKSSVLLRGSAKQRSYRYAGDNSCCQIDLESASEDGGNEKHIKGSVDLMLTGGIDLNAISPCYSPDVVANSFCLADGDKKFDLDCNSTPDSGEHLNIINLDSVSRPDRKSSGSKFHVDLNLYIDEDESSPLPSLSTEVDLHAPESPENKEQSPPRVDSDENQLDIPCQLSMPEKGKPQEDLVTMAAEAIVSISSSQVQKGDSLYWFAKLASSVVDDPESEFGMVLSCKNLDHHDEIDYFEAMTLQLEETMAEEYCCKATSIQVEAACPASLPRRGRTRRGRQQRKDFQSEILPSLASLSRYEVNEDLQAIGGLIEAAQCSTACGRRIGRNGWTRGRRGRASLSSKTETPLCLQLNQQSGHGECSVEERNLIDWGKITRRRRGQRCPANNPRLILGQV